MERIIHGDSREELKQFEDNSIDCVAIVRVRDIQSIDDRNGKV